MFDGNKPVLLQWRRQWRKMTDFFPRDQNVNGKIDDDHNLCQTLGRRRPIMLGTLGFRPLERGRG